MPRITLDASQWFKGASTSDNLNDGGFSPDERGISLFVSPGLIKPGYQEEVGWTNTNVLAQGVIAWTPNDILAGSSSVFALSRNSSDDGQISAHSATTGSTGSSSVLYGPDSGRNYTLFNSDLIRYKDGLYYSSTSDIALDGDFDWWRVTRGMTALNTSYPHHLFVYGDVLYITDGRYLHSWDGSTSTYNVLDLPEDYAISAACVHNGLIYLAATYFYSSDTMHGNAFIFTWDGYSPSFLEQIPVHETLTTLVPAWGVLYATSNTAFGYFNGNAFIPLYPLTTRVRKAQIAVQKDRIVIAQGTYLLVYGNPIKGRQRFFSMPFKTSLANIQSLTTFYQDYAAMGAESANSLLYIDLGATNTSGNASPKFKHNRIALGEYSRIRAVTVELDAAVSSSTSITVSYLNSNGDTVTLGTVNNANHTGQREVYLTGDAAERATYTVQLQLQWGVGSTDGVRRIHIDYDYAEDRPNK